MRLSELLEIRPGVTAAIGSGGKTTLLAALGAELAAEGRRVLLCATTKIYPFRGLPNLLSPTAEELSAALEREGLVCAGTAIGTSGKLTAPALPMKTLAALADYVLVEADGAAGLPLKAHAPWEPAIPPEAGQTVCVVGLSGIGMPIAQAAHRPEIFAALAGADPGGPASADAIRAVLNAEALPGRVFLNKADDRLRRRQGRALAEGLRRPAAVGSLRREEWEPC